MQPDFKDKTDRQRLKNTAIPQRTKMLRTKSACLKPRVLNSYQREDAIAGFPRGRQSKSQTQTSAASYHLAEYHVIFCSSMSKLN